MRQAGAAPVADAPVTGTAGKWHYSYVDSSDPDMRPLGQRAKQWGVLEQMTEDLARRYVMPNDMDDISCDWRSLRTLSTVSSAQR